MRTFLPAAVALVAVSLAGSARAQATDPEALFKEGSALMEQGQYEQALPKLEAAQKADPGIGTQFNIAVCHQKLGHLGTAYRGFRDVAALARASGKKTREDAARERLEQVKPAAPAFLIESRETGDVTVRVDGVALAKSDWTYYPVDPGEHTIEAIAPAKTAWSTKLPTPPGGKVETVVVPALARDTVTVTRETTNGRRTLGFILGGLGVAGAITAGITGAMLLSDHATAEEQCTKVPGGKAQCGNSPEAVDAVNRSDTLLPLNAIAWGVAAVGLGAGAFLLLTSGKKADAPRTALAPLLGPSSGGASLSGTF